MSWISHGLMISKTSIRVDEKDHSSKIEVCLRFVEIFVASMRVDATWKLRKFFPDFTDLRS